MNLLAFDTSTEMMSVAVSRVPGGAGQTSEVWQHTAPGGAQTSAHLIPAIQRLMAQAGLQYAQLDAIAFGCGPGSFTGLRTACAVAQGLAFGAEVKVLPVDTLLSVAEEARARHAAALQDYQVVALLDARMDEMYAGSYVFKNGHWTQIEGSRLIHPEALACEPGWTLAGNVFAAYGARLSAPVAQRVDALPTATAMLRLAPALLAAGAAVRADQALPLYIRDKVAKTTLERAAEKAAL
ncbi:MAG: tRNA (adenosine(37)-N6)-threonylcarbamoyltransferase complex dimerization subunit type 1 TsaB [Rhodoferax sp.]|nr:tRNA (adenosine(37)-N6)-threonylcarbamoyltransferase complex dimerization subunit type 1 TsaB [Rhodoferax sp.]